MLRFFIFVTLLLLQALPFFIQIIVADDMESVVVSASRTPVTAALSGSSVTIVDREMLEQRQLSTLSEILREVPGIAVNRGGVPGSTTQIRMRGAEANQLLVFIDGIEVNDLSQNSEFNFAHLSAAEIERAEIIRGPQSALWGSDALAGVINITTRRGDGPVSVSGFTEAGSFGTWQGGGNISGGSSTYNYSVAGSYLKSRGDNISRQGDENDGYENASITFSTGYSPLEYLSFELVSRFTEAKNEFDETDFLTTGLPSDTDSHTQTSQNYSRLLSILSLYDGAWEHKAGIALSSNNNDNFINQVESSSNQGKKYKFDYQTSLYLKTTGVASAAHIITFAIEHEIEEFTQRGTVQFGNDPNQDLDTDTTSFIGEYRITFSDKLSVSGSVRRDNNSAFKDATTFRTTAAYLVNEYDLRLHGSYGSGVKNPTFTERFGFFASSLFSPFVGNPALEPEKSRGWDIGLEKVLLNNRLELGLTYFNEKLTDEINGFFFDAVTFTSTAVNETGKSRREGVELSARLSLSDKLSLSGNYTYLDAMQPDATGGQEREVRRPEHIANMNLNYIFLNERGNINLSANYNGRQDDFFFAPPFFARQTVSLKSFTLLNIATSYSLNNIVSIYGRIENLLDYDYEEVHGFSSTGLSAYAGIKIKFTP